MQHRNKNKDYYISIIFILISVLFWGYSFISTKIVLTELPPISIAFFRQIIATVVLLTWLIVTKSLPKVSPKYYLGIAISAFLGIVLYFIFENNGLRFTSASNASMIVASVPVFTLISEILFFKLKPNFKMAFCIILSIVGVYLVISVNGKLDFSSSTVKGNLLVIGAMISWVAYTSINKALTKSQSTMVITTYQITTSTFLFIPFVIPEVNQWNMLSIGPLLNLIYLGIFCSALAYFFFIYASKRLGATVSSAFLNLIPVVSVVAGYIVLSEKLSLIQLCGMVLIIISLFLLSKQKTEKRD